MSKRTTWPRYRASTWIDTSEESMAQEEPTLRYGIQRQTAKGGKWLHVSIDGKNVALFDTEAEAAAKCDELQAKAEAGL